MEERLLHNRESRVAEVDIAIDAQSKIIFALKYDTIVFDWIFNGRKIRKRIEDAEYVMGQLIMLREIYSLHYDDIYTK